MNEEEFKNYLRAVTTQLDTSFDEKTIDDILDVLKNRIPNEIKNIPNILDIEDIKLLNEIKKRLSIGGDLYEFNRADKTGRPSQAIFRYIDFLKFTCLQKTMKRYDNTPDSFVLNEPYWYYKIDNKEKLYPVKVICRECIDILELDRNFHTGNAKSILKKILSKNNLEFIDIRSDDSPSEGKIYDKNLIKNIILYGSPGVGKTYNHEKIIALLEGGDFSDKEVFDLIISGDESRIEEGSIKELYKTILNEKRMKFITFHQSFGYEDFIEGFRPNEEGNIELEKGIFLDICKLAEENLLKSGENKEVPFSDAFKTIFKEKIEKEESVTVSLKRAGSFFKINDYNDKTIYFEKQSGTTKHTLSIATLEKMYNAEKNDFINGGLAVYYEPILDKLLEIKRKSVVEQVDRKNYYLVIDEINRGNISKIFGELITLIEEDKRDTLEVTLPYSKMPFKIPSNLYIIGTMNSTDKSIALIDIALRRRFTFLKMEPNTDLVKNEKAKIIMEQLNEKITETLGTDYVLGHSYFMKIENDDDLEFVLEYKIKPLLEEYFYGDSEGLKQILEMIDE